VRITHTQETGTLEKQRFIDQYDYVFMTKEPTKWMVKGGNSSGGTMAGQFLAYEHKVLPSISLGAGIYTLKTANIGIFGELRFYYDMKRRIVENKNTNNFSGNYIGVFSTYNMKVSDIRFDENTLIGAKQSFELRWGAQRRFFNFGFVDIGISIGKINLEKLNGNHPIKILEEQNSYQNEIFFQTNWRVGLAWGDFKRNKNIPICEVLRCYEVQNHLFKIAWPKITLGLNQFNFNSTFGYEHKIGYSFFSINTQTNIDINNWKSYNSLRTTEYVSKIDNGQLSIKGTKFIVGNFTDYNYQILSFIQPRFYLKKFQNKIENKYNLSGWYLGVSFIHIFKNSGFKFTNLDFNSLKCSRIEIGPALGIQQKIFKKGYLDFNFNFAKTIYTFQSNTSNKSGWSSHPSLKLGFAL
jgi:hypothetical protein